MLRRNFIKGVINGSLTLLVSVALFKPLRAFATWNKEAFSATKLNDALVKFSSGKEITPSDKIKIGVHPVIENGAVVPIKINTPLPNIKMIAIFVEKNPNPLIASFELAEGCKGFIATRIKVAEPSKIIAVVQSNEEFYRNETFVDVVEGGCA